MDLESSYRAAESISRQSGSSFYKSFDFLQRDRRRAMHALYAFARIVDDAADLPASNIETSNKEPSTTKDGSPKASNILWNCDSWRDWVRQLASNTTEFVADDRLPPDLQSIRLALSDSVQRYNIPVDMLDSLVLGVDMDARGERINTLDDLRSYAFRVASTVGICCMSIWTNGRTITPSDSLWQPAVDCGIAFQMTNILRDLREDAERGRIYLPVEDLERFGIAPRQWLDRLQSRSTQEVEPSKAWVELVGMECERAMALYERGWSLHDQLEPDSFRMFSLMWNTYRSLLERISQSPRSVFQSRIRLTRAAKLNLAWNHCFTPNLLRGHHSKQVAAPKLDTRRSAPGVAPRVAVVGGGLAGMNAAFHLARHGCQVALFEGKSRLGGRAGSFVDAATGQSVDYCQHVGMQCCGELRRWIGLTDSETSWREVDTLHFVSNRGRQIAIRGWPLPAPFHMSGLLLRWPELTSLDRIRVGWGLASLMIASDTEAFQRMPALEWLENHFQNQRTIANFWATILVSALGEQVDRVAMGPVKKVLVDGFAATRDAYHLLVPTVPLAQWIDDSARRSLERMRVMLKCSTAVSSLERSPSGEWLIDAESHGSFDAVVVAVPWHKVQSLFQETGLPSHLRSALATTSALESSPITGVHTWWDRAWLKQPHAILIDRLCQWVFPVPESSNQAASADETYYQIVISGSRQLPRGNSDAVLEAVRADLAEIFPEAAQSRLLRGKVVTDPQSVFSVSPGHASSRLTSDTLASEGIFLGGDWTETGWPATMEGALRSGLLAAQCALNYLGRPARLIENQ